tara:strand:+ start:146 stop:316 length:171 start_codon:yes stop_codon:yes gene_type:complete
MTKQTERLKKEVEMEQFYQIYTVEEVRKAVLSIIKNKKTTEMIIDILEYEKFEDKN